MQESVTHQYFMKNYIVPVYLKTANYTFLYILFETYFVIILLLLSLC
jgi:hypothetical protein